MKDLQIAERIKSLIKKRRMTQGQLSQITGFQQSVISEMLNGKRNIIPLAEKVAEKFGASRDWIIGGCEVLDEFTGGIELDQEQRQKLLERLNDLYSRHQDIIREEQEIMKQMMTINRMLIVGTNQ